MARSRNIKPAFFLNDELAELSPLTRLLFIGLWCVADRDGYLEDKPNKIKAEILPYDNCDVNKMLEDLDGNFIQRYSVDNKNYIFIKNFSKHQNPHLKEKPSEIPRITEIKDKYSTSMVQAPDKHNTNPSDSFNPLTDSFNPQQLITENQKSDSCVDGSSNVDNSCVDGLQNANDSRVDGLYPELDLHEVIDFYEKNIGLISPYGLEVLADYAKEMPQDLIIFAMQKAVEANVKTIQYIKGILNNWSKRGIKTLIEAKEEDIRFKNKKLVHEETEEEAIQRKIKELEECQ